MTDSHSLYDAKYQEMLAALPVDLTDESATHAMKAFETFSKSAPAQPEPEIIPDPVPTTRRGKIWAGTARALDNETTRTAIKAGGAFAGVVAVIYAGIHKDHVIERQALNQANQPPAR